MKIPASRRKAIHLEVSGGETPHAIEMICGQTPYLIIRNRPRIPELTTELMCVRDCDVTKLRDMCNEILDRRELEKTR